MALPDSSVVAEEVSSGATEPSSHGSGDLAPGQADGDPVPVTVTELDKLDKFKFEGKDYTPKELKNAMLRQQDYTRKTQEHSQERRYFDNLSIDLRKVRDNPALALEFRRIYPEKFHQYLEYISPSSVNTQGQADNRGGSQAQSAIDPKFADALSRFERFESERIEEKTAANEVMLESQEKNMAIKYPHADHETVYARAQALLDRNNSLPKDEQIKLSPEIFDRLYRADHDKNQKRYETFYQGTIKTQKQNGLKARDSGVGGGLPGGKPKEYKTIREARDAMLSDLDS